MSTAAWAIILDLDDTLYPEREYVDGGFQAAARAAEPELGPVDATVAELWTLFAGRPRAGVFNELLLARGQTDDAPLVQRMVHAYRTHLPRLQLFPDVPPALSRWCGVHPLGLITDGRPEGQRAKLAALGMASFFDQVIVTDEWGTEFRKPHHRAFIEMTRRLGVPAARCVYVGDNPAKDFLAPSQLGWLTVRVLRPGALYACMPAPPDGAPRLVISTLDDLDEHLAGL